MGIRATNWNQTSYGLIGIARENGDQAVELNTLELAGGRILFEERLNQFKDMLSTGSLA